MIKDKLLTPLLKELFCLLDEQVYFVGGAVRDALLSRPIHDVDLTTPFTPNQVIEKLQASSIRIYPTGIEHGTLTLVLKDNTTLEITSFRTDDQTDGRHAVVAFGTDMRQDALRRDFTFNALYMDGAGRLYDFTRGVKDLKKKRLRFIGQADKRIKEDALRILRYFRFMAQLEIKRPDKEALRACRQLRGLLDGLSKERIRDEMFKLLACDHPLCALHYMARCGVLKQILNRADLQALRRLLHQEKRAGIKTDALFRLWVLTQGQVPKWPLTRAQIRLLNDWNKAYFLPLQTRADFCRVLYYYGKDTFLKMILIKRANICFSSMRFFESLPVPKLCFTASDVAARFKVQGQALGQKIKVCEDIWLKTECRAKKEVVFRQILE